jgi:hypothetical protein
LNFEGLDHRGARRQWRIGREAYRPGTRLTICGASSPDDGPSGGDRLANRVERWVRSWSALAGEPRLPDGIEPVASLEMAMARCAAAPELCVIGGAEVYAQAFPLATRLELTRVHVEARGDVRFPEFDAAQWHELERIEHPADARHEWPMTFLTLERV